MRLFTLRERKTQNRLPKEIFNFEGEWILLSDDHQTILAHAKELRDILDETERRGKRGSFMKVPPANAILIPGVYGI